MKSFVIVDLSCNCVETGPTFNCYIVGGAVHQLNGCLINTSCLVSTALYIYLYYILKVIFVEGSL